MIAPTISFAFRDHAGLVLVGLTIAIAVAVQFLFLQIGATVSLHQLVDRLEVLVWLPAVSGPHILSSHLLVLDP